MLTSLIVQIALLAMSAHAQEVPECSSGKTVEMQRPHNGPSLMAHQCCMDTTEEHPFLLTSLGKNERIDHPFLPAKATEADESYGLSKYSIIRIARHIDKTEERLADGWLPVVAIPGSNSSLKDYVRDSLWTSDNLNRKTRNMFKLGWNNKQIDGAPLDDAGTYYGFVKVADSGEDLNSLIEKGFVSKDLTSFLRDPNLVFLIEDDEKFQEQHFPSSIARRVKRQQHFVRPDIVIENEQKKYRIRKCERSSNSILESVLETDKIKIEYQFSIYTQSFVDTNGVSQLSGSEFYYNPKIDGADLLNLYPAQLDQFVALNGIRSLLNSKVNSQNPYLDLNHMFCARLYQTGPKNPEAQTRFEECKFRLKFHSDSIGYNRIVTFNNLFGSLRTSHFSFSDLELWRKLDLLRIPNGELFAYFMDDPMDNELKNFHRTRRVNTEEGRLRMYFFTQGPFNSLKYVGWHKSQSISYKDLQNPEDQDDEASAKEKPLMELLPAASREVKWTFGNQVKEVDIRLSKDAVNLVQENMILRKKTPPEDFAERLMDWVVLATEENLKAVKLEVSSSTFLKTRAACSHLHALKAYREAYPDAPPIMHGDMYWPKGLHTHHVSGVCIDYRPVRNDGLIRPTSIAFNYSDAHIENSFLEGQESYRDKLTLIDQNKDESAEDHPLVGKHYDRFHTREFLKFLWKAGASYILFADREEPLTYTDKNGDIVTVPVAGTNHIDGSHKNHIHVCFDQDLAEHNAQRVFMSKEGLKHFNNRRLSSISGKPFSEWPREARRLWTNHVLRESNERMQDAQKRFFESCGSEIAQ